MREASARSSWLQSAAKFHFAYFPSTPTPFVSDLNPVAGKDRANLAVATLRPTGTISLYHHTGSVNVVVDELRWYS